MLNADRIALPCVVTLPVLGLPTRFATNEPAMLETVDDAFGVWRALAGHDAIDRDVERPVQVRIVVSADPEQNDLDRDGTPIHHHMSDDLRFAARSAGSFAASDPARRLATIHVTSALVADRARFRTEMLEAVVLALLSCYDRHPIHAAAVAHRGHAMLLAAPSGTGKSTLAYVCHAAGLDLLGDDHVRVQLAPSLRIWGWPSRVRLLADTAERIGASEQSVQTTHGKRKTVIDARDGVRADRLVATGATVCVLARDGGPVALEPLDAELMARALEAQLAPGFDRFPARWPAVVHALTARGGWRLNLSNDARDALPIVRELLARAACDA
ncbi:MAG: hypothetical protein DMD35_19735 [Gemmatimonadetes bacterium]|nr:MAG: hypothetical protein DMD35_19735 [Gemmatimonadota bacterium]